MSQQLRIGDLLTVKDTPLTEEDFFVVDNITTNTTYKISKQHLFSLPNLSDLTTSTQSSPNKLAVTAENGFISKNILDLDRHSHKESTFEAQTNFIYTLDTTLSSFNVLLPLNPPDGSIIIFSDWANNFETNSVTLVPAGSNTILKDSYLELDITGTATAIIFFSNNWSIAK